MPLYIQSECAARKSLNPSAIVGRPMCGVFFWFDVHSRMFLIFSICFCPLFTFRFWWQFDVDLRIPKPLYLYLYIEAKVYSAISISLSLVTLQFSNTFSACFFEFSEQPLIFVLFVFVRSFIHIFIHAAAAVVVDDSRLKIIFAI